MSIIERPSQTVKPATRRRPFGEGLLPPEPADVVHSVRRMLLGIGVTNYERMLMADAFDKAIWRQAHITKDAKAVELYGSEEAMRALEASRKPLPVVAVEDAPLPRARRFEPSPEDLAWAGVAFNNAAGNDYAWDEYGEWSDDLANVQGWQDGEPESVAEVLTDERENRGGGVGHPA